VRSVSFSLDALILNEHELLEHEIARTEAELDAVSNKLQRLIQLLHLGEDVEAAKEVLDKLASEVASRKQCQEQIFASIEVLKRRLAEAA
jgi:uncharacterized protein YydD (DUF2326 family)